MKDKVQSLGEIIRSLREQRNLSLREVSTAICVDTSLLGKIERNERQATRDQIKQISIFFQIDEKQLMKELISDQIACKIIEEHADIDILKVAEAKISLYKEQSGK
jgi:transcriptional regulator with XRE-family HTH domain